jgi:hypothetical protein
MDIALEGGFVTKPSNGWFAKVNRETGEIGEKKRMADTLNGEFWDSILTNAEFKEYVKSKFAISYGSLLEEDTVLGEADDNDGE